MDLDRETRRVAMDVRSGWDPRLHGGFGYGSAPEAREATRTIPNVPLAPEAIPALPAGGYGGFPGATDGFTPFHNLAPRTRRERRSMTNKEALEKMRLKERSGGYHKYVDPGSLVSAVDEPSSALYMPEQERFITDVAGEDKYRREVAQARRATELLRRREREAEREEDRWRRMEEAKRAEEERVARLRESGTKALRNQPSVPFDIITQHYAETEGGAKLRYSDEMVRFRSAMRAQFLQEKSRGQDFDVVSGVSRGLMALPSKPAAPSTAAHSSSSSGSSGHH